MLPYWHVPAFWFGATPVSSYLTLFAAALLVGHFGLILRARALGLSGSGAASLSAASIVGGLAGAMLSRLAYSAQLRAVLWADPVRLFFLYPGFASFGGIAGGLLGAAAALRWMRAEGGERLRWLDALAYVFPVALAVGRLGCALNHDHPGVRTASVLGVGYPDGVRFDLGVLEFLFLVALLIPAQVALATRPRRPGLLFAAFAVVYGAFRLGLDQLHIDPPRFYGVTVDQWAGLGLVAVGVAVWWRSGAGNETPAITA